MSKSTCCFIGHRTVKVTEELKKRLIEIIEELITKENVDTFLFGSKSQFNSLCLDILTSLKKKHPHVKRVYVRAEFMNISKDYKAYLLEDYEDTYYPEGIIGAGRAVYIKRNYEMIKSSRFCVIYYDSTVSTKRKSGSKVVLDYALKLHRDIFLLP